MTDLLRNYFGEYWLIIALFIPVALYYALYIYRYLSYIPYASITPGMIPEKLELRFVAPSEYRLLLYRKIAVFLFFIYSASFLSAVMPSHPAEPVADFIYAVGAVVYTLYGLHIVFLIYAYRLLQYERITLSEAGMYGRKRTDRGDAGQNDGWIELFSVNTKMEIFSKWNVLYFRNGDRKTAIPLFFLADRASRRRLQELLPSEKPKTMEKGQKGIEFFESVIIALILAMHIRQFLIQAFYIPSGSMELTLRIGDHLIVDKLSLGPFFPPIFGLDHPVHLKFLAMSEIHRGDIIVFRPPDPEEHREFIKRVIGLPGETFEIKDGRVWINDKPLDEPYLGQYNDICVDYYTYLNDPAPPCPLQPITEYQNFFFDKIVIPPDHYLMLGDNRENSSDSRSWGFVPKENIRGKAWILYFNYFDFFIRKDFSRFGFIQ